jgi:anti-anti-sigma factor
MTIKSHTSSDGKTVTISIQGRFDFQAHEELRMAYESAGKPVSHYAVDFAQTEYLDSSALGMLLMLRKHAGGRAGAVTLMNPNPAVMKILQIANFDKLFAVRSANA